MKVSRIPPNPQSFKSKHFPDQKLQDVENWNFVGDAIVDFQNLAKFSTLENLEAKNSKENLECGHDLRDAQIENADRIRHYYGKKSVTKTAM